MKKEDVLNSICPPLDSTLATQLLDEFISLEKRFVLRDWEPATLDGGQFSEAAARILYHADSGTINYLKSVDKCLKYVEDPDGKNPHNYPD